MNLRFHAVWLAMMWAGCAPETDTDAPIDTDTGADTDTDVDTDTDTDTDVDTDTDTDTDVDTDTDTDTDTGLPPAPWPTTWPDVVPGSWSTDHLMPGFQGDNGTRVRQILPDGSGGLYVGGDFVGVDTLEAEGLVHFDGTDFTAVGTGRSGNVSALAMLPDGRLVAASATSGWIGPVVTLHVLETTGTWTDVGGYVDGTIRDLLVLPGGEVLVVGDFNTIASVDSPGVVRWDPLASSDAWTAVDGFAAWGGHRVRVATERAGYDYCLAGSFGTVGGVTVENAACHDGSDWSAWGTDIHGEIYGIEVSGDGRTMAYGSFTVGTVPDSATGLAAWNATSGAWEVPVEGGVGSGGVTVVKTMMPTADGYVIGGSFLEAGNTFTTGGIAAQYLAEYDGIGWTEFGGGVGSFLGPVVGDVPGVYALYDDGTNVWAGGHLQRAPGGLTGSGLAAWDGQDWSMPFSVTQAAPLFANGEDVAVARDHTVFALAVAGGSQGELRVLELSGTEWTNDLGAPGGAAWDLWSDDQGLVRASGMLTVGGADCGVARYENRTWTCEVATPGEYRQVAEHPSGGLVVAGKFDHGNGVRNVARWDGAQWVALGAGVGSDDSDYVTKLAVSPSGDVYVAGVGLDLAGAAVRVAEWDGSAWSEVPLSGTAYGLAWHDGQLLIGGSYLTSTQPGASGDRISIATWDGTDVGVFTDQLTAWGSPATVWAMMSWQDGLIVQGSWQEIGGVAAGNVAWFDGTTWHPMGEGTDDLVAGLAVGPDGVWAAGPFRNAGGTGSLGIAHWLFAPTP